MKRFIIAFIIILFLSLIFSVLYLMLSVNKLDNRIDTLTQVIRDMRSEKQNISGTSENTDFDDEAVRAAQAAEEYNRTAEENLANAEDTLKVYLTFDDGPSGNSDRILDILDDYNVKATFFVNGRTDDHSMAVYKRIVDEGHTIAMHSYTHKYSEIYKNLENFTADLEKIQNLIYEATGVESTIYRFPGGSSNGVSSTDMSVFIQFLNEHGIKYFDWNVASGDATNLPYTSSDLIENVMSDVVKYKTSVVLMHDADNKMATVEALPELIELLQEQGALILPISEDTTLIQHVTIQ
ncbi:MAG: polysaccharide deacetylase [Lachnospiraceae bacterium]|nr:polysaccharide deacetylase [Lachnospiraceae bacterium]